MHKLRFLYLFVVQYFNSHIIVEAKIHKKWYVLHRAICIIKMLINTLMEVANSATNVSSIVVFITSYFVNYMYIFSKTTCIIAKAAFLVLDSCSFLNEKRRKENPISLLKIPQLENWATVRICCREWQIILWKGA